MNAVVRRRRWPIVLSFAAIAGAALWGRYEVNLGRARRAAAIGDLHSARVHLDAAQRYWAAGTAWQCLAAQVARRSGHLYDAKNHLERCSGDCEFERELFRAQTGEFTDDAKLQSLLDANHADSASIRDALAGGCIATRDMARLASLVEKWPDSQAGSGWRGRSYYYLGKLPEAIADLAPYLERHPEADDVRAELAQAYFHTGHSGQGLRHGRIVAKREQASATNLLALAQCLHDQALFQDQLDLLDRLLKREPGNQAALVERARTLMRLGRAADGERAAREVTAADPYSADAWLVLAKCLEAQDRKAEAKDAESRWQAIDAARYHLNSVMPRIGTTNDPERVLTRDASLLAQAATCFQDLGQTQQMLEMCQLALGIDRHHRETHRLLADYYERTGSVELARIHREAAAKP